jgi:hypothetical protein
MQSQRPEVGNDWQHAEKCELVPIERVVMQVAIPIRTGDGLEDAAAVGLER